MVGRGPGVWCREAGRRRYWRHAAQLSHDTIPDCMTCCTSLSCHMLVSVGSGLSVN